jgi:hypothetical protein
MTFNSAEFQQDLAQALEMLLSIARMDRGLLATRNTVKNAIRQVREGNLPSRISASQLENWLERAYKDAYNYQWNHDDSDYGTHIESLRRFAKEGL